MARTALIEKNKKRKRKIQITNRCLQCGRERGTYRKFGLCRICLRALAHKGELPGVVKSSW